MNLLVKIRNCGALILILAIFNSCEKKGGFGIGTDDVAPVEFVSTDISIGSSVVLLDSIRTSGVGRILFGSSEHPVFGALEATGYVGLSARTAVQPTIPSTAQLDSVKINFKVGYAYDTSSNNRDLSIEIYNLVEEFPDTTYISSNSLEAGTRLLASGDVVVEKFDSSYTISADMTWGSEFFEGVRSKNENFTKQDNFRDFFPGFVIKSKAGQDNIFSITPGNSFELVFYYQEPNADNSGVVNKSFKMDTEFMPYFFNMNSDLSSTEFSEVQQVNTEYENTPRLGLLTSFGLVPRFDLSALLPFSDDNPGLIINQAILEVGAIDDLPDGTLPPAYLVLFFTDDRNTLIPNGQTFRAVQVDGANPLGSANPVQLFYNAEDRVYRGSITSYVKSYYNGEFRRDQLFAYPAEMNQSVKSLSLSKEKINLKIFYSELR